MILSVDTETTGMDFLHGCKPFLVTMCDGTHNYYWSAPVNNDRTVSWKQNDIECIIDMLDRAKRIIFHNAEFDIRALESIGIDFTPYWSKTEDTQVAWHTLYSSSKKALKYLTVKYLQIPIDDEEQLKLDVVNARKETPAQIAKKGHPHFPAMKASWKQDMWLCFDQCLTYAIRDVERTWILWEFITKELTLYRLRDIYRFRMNQMPALHSMYRFGIHVDTNGLKQEIVKLENECESIRKTIQTLTGLPRLNFNSPIDLRTLFVLNLKLPEVKTESGKDSYAKDVIKYYGSISKDPVVKLFQQWNTVNTEIDYLTQYLAWSHNSRIHPIYSLCGTKQTRQSSFNPNGQNILKKVAHLFYPPPGKIWLDVDCVNIELRIWAYSVGSIELVTRFEAGESIHAMITLILYPSLASLSFDDLKKTKQYDQCKAGNFSRIYGAGDKKANATYGVHNACEIIDKHFPEISRFTKTCVQMAQASVETFFEPAIFTKKGYKVDVPQNKLYKAVNAYVQGTAGEIMGLMMIECFKKDYPMFQQVHDSLKFELDESQEHLIPEILATMRSAGETVIPSCHLDHKVIRHVSV